VHTLAEASSIENVSFITDNLQTCHRQVQQYSEDIAPDI